MIPMKRKLLNLKNFVLNEFDKKIILNNLKSHNIISIIYYPKEFTCSHYVVLYEFNDMILPRQFSYWDGQFIPEKPSVESFIAKVEKGIDLDLDYLNELFIEEHHDTSLQRLLNLVHGVLFLFDRIGLFNRETSLIDEDIKKLCIAGLSNKDNPHNIIKSILYKVGLCKEDVLALIN